MCEQFLEPVALIQYDVPFKSELSTNNAEESANIKPKVSSQQLPTVPSAGDAGFPVPPNIPGLIPESSGGNHDSGFSSKDLKEILNVLFPPKDYQDEEGVCWRQEISTTPAGRLDVISLQENLVMNLKQRQARESGICPIRRELYSQVFDELIRQVTLNNAERGMVLVRIRDEIRMTLCAHQAVFENSFAYGTRKAIKSEDENIESKDELDGLIEERNALKNEVQELIIKIEQLERKFMENKEVDEKQAAEEIQFLKRANQQLKAQVDGIQGSKKN